MDTESARKGGMLRAAEDLLLLGNEERCLFKNAEVLDTTSAGHYAVLCREVVGLQATHCPLERFEDGQLFRFSSWHFDPFQPPETHPPPLLIFCDREVPDAYYYLLEPTRRKHLISTCEQRACQHRP